MLTKIGVNTTHAQKRGPVVSDGAPKAASTRPNAFKRIVLCAACGCRLEKACPSEASCDISAMPCPKCGAEVR